MVDLWLVCGDGEAVPAHQLLLAQVSPSLSTWLREARAASQEEAITLLLPHWGRYTVVQFISALYQGHLPDSMWSINHNIIQFHCQTNFSEDLNKPKQD